MKIIYCAKDDDFLQITDSLVFFGVRGRAVNGIPFKI